MEDKASGQDKGGSPSDAASLPEEPDAVPLTDIRHPGENDVMFGRGGDTNYHIGNHRFRMLADEYCKQYHEASRKEKAAIVQQVSLWHDVGTDMALKKAAKILSERSSEYRTRPSSRKRKGPQRQEHAREARGAQASLTQDNPTFGSGGPFVQQQPMQQPVQQPMQQPGFAQMQPGFGGYQANYPQAQPTGYAPAFQGETPHPAFAGVAAAGFSFQGMPSGNQGVLVQGSLTEQNLATVANAAAAAGAPPLAIGGADPSSGGTPAGRGVARGSAEIPTRSRQEAADDDSPETIVQDSSAGKEDLPSAASLAGVFTSSSSDARGKDSSPSTDDS